MNVEFSESGEVVSFPDDVYPVARRQRTGMMPEEELLYLAGSLAVCPWLEDSIVVEIGAYVGSTAVFVAQVMQMLGKKVPILSIDPFERFEPDTLNPQGIYSLYARNIVDHEVADVCLPLIAFSHEAHKAVPGRIGVLLVDGSHHYSAVSLDLKLYGPKVLPGGFIFLDDYSERFDGVMQAADEYFMDDGPFEVIHRSDFVIARRRELEPDTTQAPPSSGRSRR